MLRIINSNFLHTFVFQGLEITWQQGWNTTSNCKVKVPISYSRQGRTKIAYKSLSQLRFRKSSHPRVLTKIAAQYKLMKKRVWHDGIRTRSNRRHRHANRCSNRWNNVGPNLPRSKPRTEKASSRLERANLAWTEGTRVRLGRLTLLFEHPLQSLHLKLLLNFVNLLRKHVIICLLQRRKTFEFVLEWSRNWTSSLVPIDFSSNTHPIMGREISPLSLPLIPLQLVCRDV